ncbi:MAG: IPT/TIG domain-containing protein [Bacteroidia bacterium]
MRVDGHTAGGPSFSYFGDVSVTSINPDHGKAGDAITIHGTNFRTNLNDNRVLFFDEIEALDILSGTDTTLTVKVPEGAETGPVSVEVAGKRADGPVFTYDLVEISALVPDHGRAGESIRIEGANFNLVPGLNEVSFNGIAGNVTSAAVDHIIVTVPVGVIDGPVSVTVGGYTTQGPTFTVDLPEITSLSAQQGKKDDLITIHGNYFGTNPNAIVVKFNGKQATLASAPTETQLDVFVPARAGTGPVTVDVNGALATGPVFTYTYTTVVYTFAGDGTAGSDNGQGTAARFKVPTGIEFGSDGHFYIADRANHRIRKITQGGDVSTFAGDVQGYEDGQGTAAKFKAPGDIVMDANGDIIVVDEQNNRLRKIDAQGNVTSFSGNGQTYQYNNPSGIAIAPNGNLFVADTYNNRILKVSPNGTFTIFAGGGTVPGYADGVGADAKFSSPTDVAVDSAGNVYVADRNNGMIRKITPNAVVTTIAGNLTSGYEDGQGSAAKFKSPTSITMGPDGNIYVADLLNHRIRMVTPSGLVSTIAGSGFYGFINGSGEQAEFKNPEDLVFDDEGNLYIADSNNHSIRKISFE